MAVVMTDGFGFYSAAQASSMGRWSSSWNSVAAGRFGGQSLRIVNAITSRALPSTYSTIIFGFAFQVSSVSSVSRLIHFIGGGANRVNLTIVASGGSQVFRLTNNASTTLATGTTALLANVWYYVEIKMVISATIGSVELRLNGSSTPECSATSVNTGSTNIDTIQYDSADGEFIYANDMYVVDTTGSAPTNDFLGDIRVETLMGTAEGANTAWTANTGTKVSRVNDSGTYDSDTGYIYSSTPGDRETFTIGSLVTTTGTVFAVQTNMVARKDGGATRTIAPVIRKSGVNYDGTTTAALGASYVNYTQIYDKQDPSAVDWSIATVNAMEVGVKEVA